MTYRFLRFTVLALCAVALSAASVSAETLLMPKRDAIKGTSLVVWGVTTLSGATYTIDFGDGNVTAPAAVTDQSYIFANHTYASSGNFTATITVTAGSTTETATVPLQVFDTALLTPDALRGLKINNAIQDGLRWLWTSQSNRQGNFPFGVTTNWAGSWPTSWTSLIVLAFENHGYQVPNSNADPNGIYEKYVVRRGLNFILDNLYTRSLSTQAAGDPCVGAGIEAAPCTGLFSANVSTDWWSGATVYDHTAYMTAVAVLPLAASGALNRTVAEIGGGGSGGYVVGKSYGEVLQRLTNSMSWGQIDSCSGQGGWGYELIDGCNSSDGSTVGWGILSLFDAGAAGAVVPAWVKTQVGIAMTNSINNDGSLDYQSDANPASYNSPGIEKGGIGLQGLFFSGTMAPFAAGSTGDNVVKYISDRWTSGRLGNDAYWGCDVSGQNNFGCAYSMFNSFKGLKLQGITTLAGSTRPAGPGAQPAGDWYAEYQDWLVTNQDAPATAFGGQWSLMQFSCCANDQVATAAIAELILSPVALVLPDEDKFASVGLTPATNTALEGGTHTVTAHAESTGGSPVPGATVTFTILSGPNAGMTGTDTTDSNGDATFTYTDAGPLGTHGTDTIRATIGTLTSNSVVMIWTPLNRPPVATDNAYTTDEDTSVSGNAVTDAPADSDPDAGDTLTATLVTGVSNGTLSFTNGAFTYTPTPDACGYTDSFTYQLNDGTVNGNIATVTITVACVNDPPVANDNAHVTPEDTAVSGTATSSDIDGGAPTYALATGAANGSVNVNPDGTYTYTPNANFNGSDAFTFTVSDGNGGSDTGTVTITVTPVNDPPVANDNAHTTPEDTPVSGAATSTDVDGGVPSYTLVTGPTNGTLTFNANGTYTYTPNANYYGPDSFTFTVSDGNGGSDGGQVNINVTSVNDAPFCSAAAPTIGLIWPPNHQLVNVNVLGVTDIEGAITITINEIWQDEPTNTQGDGNTPIDGYGLGSSTAQVRAERSGSPRVPGNGRVYHILFTGTDSQNATCTGTVTVGVPHDQGQRRIPVDDGKLYKSTPF